MANKRQILHKRLVSWEIYNKKRKRIIDSYYSKHHASYEDDFDRNICSTRKNLNDYIISRIGIKSKPTRDLTKNDIYHMISKALKKMGDY